MIAKHLKGTYCSWRAARERCYRVRHDKFPDYGGRGITMCERWARFENFLADMGVRPSLKHSLDRIDSNGNYEPSNCRWATMKEQRNNARNTIYLEYDGRVQAAGMWAQEYGIKHRAFMSRIDRGWPMERALLAPVKQQHGGKRPRIETPVNSGSVSR